MVGCRPLGTVGLSNYKIIFLFHNQNIYVVGPQKNRLNETVLLSTHNIMLQFMVKKILSFFVIIFKYTIFFIT